MLQTLFNTLRNLGSSNSKQEGINPEKPTRDQWIEWASSCMLEGLPDTFFSAWLEYTRREDHNFLSYQFIMNEGDDPQPFQAADELFPVSCIEQLNQFLPEGEKNWVRCKIEFNTQHARLLYTY